MRKRLLLTSIMLVLLVGAATVVRAAPFWQTESAVPRVTETLPFEGEELQLTQPITLYFNQAMNRESVEAALSVAPDTAQLGTLAWADDLSLTITPEGEWPRDTLLEFTVGTEATSAEGTALEEAYQLTYQTVGFLEVVEFLPTQDEKDVSADSVLTIIFNRPVVPLVSIEEQDTLVNPIEISPTIEGEGKWLNTSIYTFTPKEGWGGGLEYTVTIPEGLTDPTGAILADSTAWSFTTVLPQIYALYPYGDATQLPLDQAVTVEFTQPMNPGTTTEAIRITDSDGNPVIGSYKWTDSNRLMTFTPKDLLALGTRYVVEVDETVATSMTGAKLKEGDSIQFTTVPYPEIISTDPSDGMDGAYPYGGFSIYFNTYIDDESLEDKIIIEPAPWREYDTYYYDYDFRFSLFFDTEPSTDYTVTILPGIKDIYGNEIKEGLTVRYSTAPYDPEINLNIPGFVGLYSAYNETTRVFATHRNIDTLDLELYRVELETLMRLTGQDSWDFRDSWFPSRRDLRREWTMRVQSQPNERRYELLRLSEQGNDGIENIQCLGAPPITMQVGDTGIVSDNDPRPLRIRSLPNLQGEILTELAVGKTFTITDGPICADTYIWWQIETTDENPVIGWAAEGTDGNYFMEMVERAEPTVNPADYPPLAPGIYYLTLTSPDLYNPYELEHVMVVSTVNLTLKFSPDQAMAWVTDLQSGAPVANIPVAFYDSERSELGRMTTDENGIAILEIPQLQSLYTTLYAVVETDDQFGYVYSDLSNGLDPWNFNVFGDYEPENLAIYLYTDRPIYRTDQPVYFRGVIRHQDDVTFTLPTETEIPVKIYDPQGQIVYEQTLTLTPQGSFSGEFHIDKEGALGYYRIAAELSSNQRSEFSLGFNVAEYVAPEFQVETTPAEPAVVQGDTVQMMVESTYFFGGAVSNAEVEWTVLSRDYFFNYTGRERYDFIDYNYDYGPGEFYDEYGEQIASGVGTTDSEGRFLVEVPADLGTRTQSQEYTIEARVIDESDQLVAGRAQVIIHQGEVYVGVRGEKYISKAGEPAKVNLIAVDWDSAPVEGQAIEYKIVERRWSSVQEEDEMGRTVWTWEVEEIPLDDGEGAIRTDAEGKASVTFTPPMAGTYKIYAETRDSRNNKILSSTYLWVTGSNYVSWRQQNSNRFDLITDADSYKVGDTAEILIASPFQGDSVALITVERGGIISHEVVRMTTNSYVYNLPIEGSHAPNIFVSVVLVKGVDENTPYAEFRMGMTQLNVDTERLALNIEVTPNVDITKGEFVGPGDEVTYTIKTTDWEGKPVSAEVGLSVTDLSVLTIAPPNSASPMEFFYSQRGVSVRTSTPLTISVDKVTQTIIDTVKGGGGGGGEAGIFDIREEFVDTPGWKPDLVTDENGLATYTVKLPDNLTTWRLDARGLTTGETGPMLVGTANSDVLSTKPLLIRPITPRFMIVGDQLEFAAVVNNNTGETQTAEVTLQGTGFELAEGVSLTQIVEIPSQGRVRVNWPATIQDVPAVKVTFFVNGNDGQFTDASEAPLGQGEDNLLPVYKYEVRETVGTGGALTGPEAGTRSEIITLPRLFDVTQGDLTVRVDRSLAAATVDGLDYLKNYPYQCIEQTVSRFLPNAITLRAFSQLGLYDAELQANLDEQLGFAVQRLYAQQHTDGGWGWFPEDESNPLTTAYAIIGLVEAGRSGYPVDQRVINRAAEFVQDYLDNLPSEPYRWQLNRQAFLIFALSQAGFFEPSAATFLYDEYFIQLNLDAKAFLALAMATMNPDDERLNHFITEFVGNAVLSATGAHFEDERDRYNWTTNTRTTALILKAMIEIDAENQLIPMVIRWLMVARNADAWESTQETAWAVMALTDWMVVTGELRPDYTFAVGLNGQEQALEDNTATQENVKETEVLRVEVAELLQDEANRLTFTRTDGQGNLYYTAHLNVYVPVPEVEAVNAGIIVDRKYYAFNDDTLTPITQGKVGDQVEVVLTIIAPSDLHYVIVEDPIPAGSSAVDPNLLTSSVVSQRPELSRTNPLYYGWGWWYFSRTEFRDEKVVMYATYLPRGTYEFRYTIRLGLQGEYNVIPPTAQEFYFPEVYGRGEGSTFAIEPDEEE